MARVISRTEAWEKAHEAFTQINFNSFDYNSIKESLIDYTKLYFPENFNDYIESSEYIAILELFAYVGELLAYRLDMNAHENFISTAQRKDSILRLAKLISYKTSRNIPARGLVKLTSIQTTESIADSQGGNLVGRQIIWNDANNSNWKEQFMLVINRALEQEFGTVAPSERMQFDDVLFELYTFNNNPINSNGMSVFKYGVTSNNESFDMELVPIALDENGPTEKRPEVNAKFSMVYGSDGLGDGSDTTGFFMYTKQGTLQRIQRQFDGVTPNQTYDINVDNINETDVWMNNVDPTTRAVLITDPNSTTLPHLVSNELRYGDWVEVDLANAENILFNTNRNRHKYEIENLDNDQVRLIFGDGEFSDIPAGSFDIWYRTSANSNTAIQRSAVVDQRASLPYTDSLGAAQTLTFTFTLVNTLQNSSKSEDIEHIRRVAPSVYYTQDRMVNGRDYNTFMLQDPSILKLRAINRTFAGDSKYIAWHDPSNRYEDVKIFGEDLAMYWDERPPEAGGLLEYDISFGAVQMLEDVIQPILSTADFFQVIGILKQFAGADLTVTTIRRAFNTSPYSFNPILSEVTAIQDALQQAIVATSATISIYFSVTEDEWTVGPHPNDPDSIEMIIVKLKDLPDSGWEVRWRTRREIAQSTSTKFWNTNTTDSLMSYDTLNSNMDSIVILKANTNSTGDNNGLMDSNQYYSVLGQELIEQGLPNAGLPDIHKLSVVTKDLNGDGIPDNLLQRQVFNYDKEMSLEDWNAAGFISNNPMSPSGFILNIPNGRTYVADHMDEDVAMYIDGVRVLEGSVLSGLSSTGNPLFFDQLAVVGPMSPVNPMIRIVVVDWVYFSRETEMDDWFPVEGTDEIRILWDVDSSLSEDNSIHYKREPGRYPLNFAWFHRTEQYHLIDPAASNIIDMFIISIGYYMEMVRWLENRIDNPPIAPTPLQLRSDYAKLLDNAMISDTVVLHPGKFKILFGPRAPAELRCKFNVIRPVTTSLTDNEVKVRIVNVIRAFFNLNNWEFGETFFATELSAAIHAELGPEIDSIVLVPTHGTNTFGDMFQIQSREDELFAPDVSTSLINIVKSYTPSNIRQST